MSYIYVLKLIRNKYYIGRSNNLNVRISSHFKLDGSSWTKLYKPIKVIEVIPSSDNYDEDKYTLRYMQQYGIDNVRGGSFTKHILEYSQIKTINTMLKSKNDECYKCGKKGHFANNCLNSKNTVDTFDSYSGDEYWECDYCGRNFDTKKGCLFHENIHCKKKYVNNYNVTYSDSDSYSDSDTEYEESTHEYIGHKDGTIFDSTRGYIRPKQKTKKNSCYRCGRTGHYSTSCYANTHIKGYYLKR
tara:strand:- start:2574 stop:3305 length:732 start_codon:yes stop_codon:yes gene_type:complete